jgi:hypothetical protein
VSDSKGVTIPVQYIEKVQNYGGNRFEVNMKLKEADDATLFWLY